ncbi:hypothetical protein Q6A48_08365 [Pseudomonas sp. K18]|uniref:Uncharacterized protein n=1 Tax=Pseudomonas citrulli TaxID=3064347 RepID=A0ABT9C1E3_9PSED|nr:hypothetical protein [Pseudomonas sp. K18]
MGQPLAGSVFIHSWWCVVGALAVRSHGNQDAYACSDATGGEEFIRGVMFLKMAEKMVAYQASK